MGPMMQAMAGGLRFSTGTIKLATVDLTEEDARRQLYDDSGPSMAWIIGHLVNFRYRMLGLLGVPRQSPLADSVGDHADNGAGYPALAELLEAWDTVTAELVAASEGVTDEQLLAPPSDTPHGERAIIDAFTFFAWHESYHVGQLGILRARWGYTPIAEMAVMASKRKSF